MDSGHQVVTEDLAFQIYNSSLEEEFNHFEDWLNIFPLYRGQGGQDGDGEEGESGHLVGKFKVCLGKEESTGGDVRRLLPVSSSHSRAPSSFTLNQRQYHSLSPKSPGGYHRTGPSSSWSESMS